MGWTIFILIVLCGLSNAIMDISSEDRFKIDWWNKNQSWQNKHTYNICGMILPTVLWTRLTRWLLKNPLVFLTDGWHLAQFVFHTSWQLIVALLLSRRLLNEHPLELNEPNDFIYGFIIYFILVKLNFSLVFQTIYGLLKGVK